MEFVSSLQLQTGMSQSDLLTPSICLEKSSRVEFAALPQLPVCRESWGGRGAADGGSEQWYPAFHLLQVVAKERLLQITAAPSPTCSHAGSKGSTPSPWLRSPGSTRCFRVLWKFSSHFPPSPATPQILQSCSTCCQPQRSCPACSSQPCQCQSLQSFPSGSLPRLLFHAVAKHITIQAFRHKCFVHRFTEKRWEFMQQVPSSLSTNAWTSALQELWLGSHNSCALGGKWKSMSLTILIL